MFFATAFALYFLTLACATPDILWEGRTPFSYTADDINKSYGPYLSVVKGRHKASYYFRILGYEWTTRHATPIWPEPEQPIGVYIDKTSIFIPGGSAPQNGFRRSEIVAQSPKGGDRTAFDATLESGVTAFHFSVHGDHKRALNYAHEYQAVWVEKPDGSHVFDLQTGTPFSTTSSSTSATSPTLRIRAHDGTVLFQTPFPPTTWHNFAVVVDWDKLTLKVYYSQDALPLQAVTDVQDNSSAGGGSQGQGDFHFGLLKLPLVNPSDTPAEQADVVHYGIQELLHEQLLYSGVFIERADNGISIGFGKTG